MQLIIAIKSDLNNFDTAYNFIDTVTTEKDHLIKMVFFYQDSTYMLLNSYINNKWVDLLKKYNLPGFICVSSCKKRGISKDNIKPPFQASSIIEFINNAEIVDRVVCL